MERTPFAIDEAKDGDEDSLVDGDLDSLDGVGGDLDNGIMDEVRVPPSHLLDLSFDL
jgi:hypothetical protein